MKSENYHFLICDINNHKKCNCLAVVICTSSIFESFLKFIYSATSLSLIGWLLYFVPNTPTLLHPSHMSFQTGIVIQDSEQIVQNNVLVHILGMFVLCDTVCRHHHQLYGMGLCMLLAMEKGINFVFKFSVVLLGNCELMFAELHFAVNGRKQTKI